MLLCRIRYKEGECEERKEFVIHVSKRMIDFSQNMLVFIPAPQGGCSCILSTPSHFSGNTQTFNLTFGTSGIISEDTLLKYPTNLVLLVHYFKFN